MSGFPQPERQTRRSAALAAKRKINTLTAREEAGRRRLLTLLPPLHPTLARSLFATRTPRLSLQWPLQP